VGLLQGLSSQGDPVSIATGDRIEASVKAEMGLTGLSYRNVLGQERVQRPLHGFHTVSGLRLEADHLSQGVNTCVCAARCNELHGLLQDERQSLFDGSLNGAATWLNLPPEEVRTVILDGQAKRAFFRLKRDGRNTSFNDPQWAISTGLRAAPMPCRGS
jgi:hypothetical protein